MKYCIDEIEKRKQEQETEQEAGLEFEMEQDQILKMSRDDWYDEDGNMTEGSDEDGSDVEKNLIKSMTDGMSGGQEAKNGELVNHWKTDSWLKLLKVLRSTKESCNMEWSRKSLSRIT